MAWFGRGNGENDSPPAEEGRTGPTSPRALEQASAMGLWALLAFTALSLWARTGFRYVPPMSENVQSWLGRPPPLPWIHGLFLVYLFSALVLSLVRMAGDWHPFGGFRHVAYLGAFYAFYHLSNGLEESFWAVLLGGLSVIGLEGYRNWLQCRQRLRESEPGR